MTSLFRVQCCYEKRVAHHRLLFRYLIVPSCTLYQHTVSHKFGQDMFQFCQGLHIAEQNIILTVRPNEHDMQLKCTKKGILLCIYHIQIWPSDQFIVDVVVKIKFR